MNGEQHLITVNSKFHLRFTKKKKINFELNTNIMTTNLIKQEVNELETTLPGDGNNTSVQYDQKPKKDLKIEEIRNSARKLIRRGNRIIKKEHKTEEIVELDSEDDFNKNTQRNINVGELREYNSTDQDSKNSIEFELDEMAKLELEYYLEENKESYINVDVLGTYLTDKDSINALEKEFNEINNETSILYDMVKSPFSYKAFQSGMQSYKNRYGDIVCLDHTRVRLKELTEDSDYIHANYVCGFNQEKAYICTQAPLENTIDDFWSMVWQEKSVVIVMLSNYVELGRRKCVNYFPLDKNGIMQLKMFQIRNIGFEATPTSVMTTLEVKHIESNKTRRIVHSQFTSWSDQNVPDDPCVLFDFIITVRKIQEHLTSTLIANNEWPGHELGPPKIVHCSAGIGRSGVFCLIDINITRFAKTKHVEIKNSFRKLRRQRARCVQTANQYVFCHRVLSLLNGRLNSGSLTTSSLLYLSSISDASL